MITPSLWILGAAQLVNALFICAVSGLGISYMQDLLPGQPGRATTMFTNTFPIGATVAGPLLGLSIHFGYRLAYAIAVTLCAAGLVLLAVRSRPGDREPVGATAIPAQRLPRNEQPVPTAGEAIR